MKRALCRTCSKRPFLFDLWIAGLAQLGQTEDFLRIFITYLFTFWLGTILYIKMS
jgi:hypothetical protein